MRPWLRSLVLATGALPLAGLLAGCPDTATTTGAFAPVTGILIRAESLTAVYGCGDQPGQLYKYVAIARGPGQYIGLFDCFTDGQFVDLATSQDAGSDYAVTIFAFDRAAYESQRASIDPPAARGDAVGVDTFEAALQGIGGPVLRPTYRTRCTATQQQDITVLAVCEPLRPDPVTADAGVSDADAASPEAGDAANDAASPEAGDAAQDASDSSADAASE